MHPYAAFIYSLATLSWACLLVLGAFCCISTFLSRIISVDLVSHLHCSVLYWELKSAVRFMHDSLGRWLYMKRVMFVSNFRSTSTAWRRANRQFLWATHREISLASTWETALLICWCVGTKTGGRTQKHTYRCKYTKIVHNIRNLSQECKLKGVCLWNCFLKATPDDEEGWNAKATWSG